MNAKQIIIVLTALAVSALIIWHDLPIEFPWIILKVCMLFLKVFIVLALSIAAYLFLAGKKKSSKK
ncbi:MAG: hypothetical protein C4518_11145 [Desulfobacteraceae bacterium]|nr:MAG: hypothetical protein C4518_11145 [Desulfobacteraceae bacterium]